MLLHHGSVAYLFIKNIYYEHDMAVDYFNGFINHRNKSLGHFNFSKNGF